MLEVKNLYKYYSSTKALNDVSLTISRGEIVGLFGANGAGKTSLMKSILGFVKCDGSINLDSEEINRNNIEKLSFATAEHTFFETLTAKEHARFYESHFEKFRKKRFNKLMEFFDLPFDKKIKNFSLGQKNQFEVILAMCQGADYILMDEPFAGNDILNREDFYKVLVGILEERETVILSTHLIEEVSNFVDRVIVLDEGKVVGDVMVSDLEDEGSNLMEYIKGILAYEPDRVSKMIASFENGELEE